MSRRSTGMKGAKPKGDLIDVSTVHLEPDGRYDVQRIDAADERLRAKHGKGVSIRCYKRVLSADTVTVRMAVFIVRAKLTGGAR